jgi:organic hydroperoxide reductase OsmC/OhrA
VVAGIAGAAVSGRDHHYKIRTIWTGNRGTGTSGYRDFDRAHVVRIAGKPDLLMSSDANFRGDGARHNPEDLLVASLSSCHMLWYLHLAAAAGLVVVEYEDEAEGHMQLRADGGGAFVRATLRPRVAISGDFDAGRAAGLHHEAHEKCFVANSVNFPVDVEPEIVAAAAAGS